MTQHSSTVIKSFDLLGVLTGSPGGMRLAELAEALNQPRTNVLRILEAARLYGFAVADGKLWRLTPAFKEWAQPSDRHEHLRRKYRGVLGRVAAGTKELVLLGLHEGNGVLILSHVDSDHTVRIAPPDTRHNLRHNAFGKLALSRRPDLAARYPGAVWKRELEEIRRTGVAWNREETVKGMVALAVPGFVNAPSEPMIAVAWPVFRFSETKGRAAVREIAAALREVR